MYSIVHSGVLGTGDVAAVPELSCVSPFVCLVTVRPAAPAADLELYVFRVDAAAPDADGDGFTDRHEYAGATDPHDPQSPGPDRSHSNVDSDGDLVFDQDEAVYGTDPNNADSDGDSSLMVKRSRTGPIPSCHRAQALTGPITTAMGSATMMRPRSEPTR